MRVTRYLLVLIGSIAVLAAVAWYLRDSLIQRYSNPRLQQYGLRITDISLNALAGDGASIGYLELEHESGTTIAITDLRLPIGKPAARLKVYSAGTVTVSPSRADGETETDIASLLDRFLALPVDLGGNEFRIGRLEVRPHPTVRDLRWTLLDGGQSIQATVDSVAVAATIARTNTMRHEVLFAAPAVVDASIQRGDSSFVLRGSSALDLPGLVPLARATGLMPDAIDVHSGSAHLEFAVEVPYGNSGSASLDADLAPTSPIRLTYAHTSGEVTSVVAESGSPLEFGATWPAFDWSVQQAESSAKVTYGEWRQMPVRVDGLSCTPGPACSLRVRVAVGAATLPVGKVASASFASAVGVRFDEERQQLDFEPGATLDVKQFARTGVDVARIRATLKTRAQLAIADEGFRLTAGSITTRLEGTKLPRDLSLSADLRLDSVTAGEVDGTADARFRISAPSLTLRGAEQRIDLPGIDGELKRTGENVGIDLNTVGLDRNGRIEAHHQLDIGAGRLTMSPLTMSFHTRRLSQRVSPWQRDWDLAAGSLSANGAARWRRSGGSTILDGRASVQASNLAGYYGETAFTGLSTGLDIALPGTGGFVAQPASIAVRFVDIGIPVEDIRADYALDLATMSLDVDGLQMKSLGGTVRADPFSFRTREDSNTLVLYAEGIDLAKLLTLEEFEAIEVSGRIAARLPVTLAADSVTISGGSLTGEPPGGVIRYLPGRQSGAAAASGVGLAARALSNFEYASLTSEVDYSDTGDLTLKLRISGRNPDMDGGRPVVLNLGVENNVPQMLKSLRAARSVEDVLKKRIEKK